MSKSITTSKKYALLLSIRPEFAERIFSGKKKFELRKRLPRRDFDRVFLYETGGGGIVGCFDVASVRSKPVQDLWSEVGEQATSRERFYAYFKNINDGNAIEIVDPVRFIRPLYPPDLKELEPQFIIPQGFVYLNKKHNLCKILETLRKRSMVRCVIDLRPIRREEHANYKSLVTKHISPRYDDISVTFARNILRLHDLGYDPNGIMTTKKVVLSLIHKRYGVVGYTTLTFKLGHALKTGPTVIKDMFRGKGLGLETRRAIEKYAINNGRRKLYCTCPDDDTKLIKHFISAGYRIEGHLKSHYQAQRGEILFGRVLEHAIRRPISEKRRSAKPGRLVPRHAFASSSLKKWVSNLFESTWLISGERFADQVLKMASRTKIKEYEDKPLSLYCLKSGTKCTAVMLIIAKRGGAAKALLLSSTSHEESIAEMLESAEKNLTMRGKRKVYFVFPLTDQEMVVPLLRRNYRPEGILEEPYVPGQDVVVLSKFL